MLSQEARECLGFAVRRHTKHGEDTYLGASVACELMDAGLVWPVNYRRDRYVPTALGLLLCPKGSPHAQP